MAGKSTLLGILLSEVFAILFLISPSFSLEWHDCCNAIVQNDQLIENYLIYNKTRMNALGEGLSPERYAKAVFYSPVETCKKESEIYKAEFLKRVAKTPSAFTENDAGYFSDSGAYSSLGGFFDAIAYQSASSTWGWEANYYSYDLHDWPGRKNVPRKGASSVRGKWSLPSSPFYYLSPKSSFSSFIERYNALYHKALSECSALYPDYAPEGYFDKESSKKQDDCVSGKMLADSVIRDNIVIYSGAGSSYVKGLIICDENLGDQHQLGILKFPGEPSGGAPKEGKCLVGYHLTEHSVCCRDGFDSKKSASGEIACVAIAGQDGISDVSVSLDKRTFLLDGKDSIIATFSFSGSDSSGKPIPYSDKKVIPLFVAESETGNMKFLAKPLSERTDSSGKIIVKITLESAIKDLLNNRNSSKVFVYSLDSPVEKRKQVFFTTEYAEGLKITSVAFDSGSSAWNGGGARIRITVSDPLSENKRYTIDTPTRIADDSGKLVRASEGMRVSGKPSDYVGYVTTRDNSIVFGWHPPRISDERKVKYGVKIRDSLKNAGITLFTSYAEDKLKKYKEAVSDTKNAVESGSLLEITKLGRDGRLVLPSSNYEHFSGLDRFYENFGKLVSFGTLSNDSINLGKTAGGYYNGENKPLYQKINDGLDGLFWMEGAVNLRFPDAKIPNRYKIPLQMVKDWYAVVAEMEELASNETMTLSVPITVTVEGLESGATDTFVATIPVEGFKAVLAEETWGPI